MKLLFPHCSLSIKLQEVANNVFHSLLSFLLPLFSAFLRDAHSSLQADSSPKPLLFHHPISNTFSDLCCLSLFRRCLIMRRSVPLLQRFLWTGNLQHILVAQKRSSGCNGLYVMSWHLAFDMRSNDVSASKVLFVWYYKDISDLFVYFWFKSPCVYLCAVTCTLGQSKYHISVIYLNHNGVTLFGFWIINKFFLHLEITILGRRIPAAPQCLIVMLFYQTFYHYQNIEAKCGLNIALGHVAIFNNILITCTALLLVRSFLNSWLSRSIGYS